MLQFSVAGANPEKPLVKGPDPGSPAAVVKDRVDVKLSRHMVEVVLSVFALRSDGLTQAIFARHPDCFVRIPTEPHFAGKYFREAILAKPFDSLVGAHPNGTV
jgi:hypothetical protein